MAQFCTSVISRAILDNCLIELQNLIAQDKSIDVQDNRGYAPLHIAIDKDSLPMFNYLLTIKHLELECRTYEGLTPLILACSKTQPNLVMIKSLLNLNANINAATKEDITALHYACQSLNIELVHVLLKRGAFIDCQDFNGYTPLHYALERKSLNLVTFLLEHNANANLTELHGLNALMFAIIFAKNCAQIIMPYIADVNAMANNHNSTIGLACAKQNIPVVKKLLELGAEVSLDTNENSAYRICVKERNLELFKLIWEEIKYKIPLYKDVSIYVLICEFIQCWGVSSVEPYEYLLSSPGLELNKSNGNFLEALVMQHMPPFDTYKENLFKITNLFLDYKITSGENELIKIIGHYEKWKYAPDLIELILLKNRPVYCQSLIIQASMHSNKTANHLLKYCYFANSDIFKYFHNYLGVYNFQFLFHYFTPKYDDLQKIIAEIGHNAENDEVVRVLNCNKIASLKEMSRDKFRRVLLNGTHLDQIFFNVIEGLDVPVTIKNMLLFREPLNNYF